MSTPTTQETMELYAALEARAKRIGLELAQIVATQETLAKQLYSRLPEADDAATYKHTFEDGVTVHVGKKFNERWVPIDGQADDFWAWVEAGQRWQFATRTLKQQGVDMWQAANSALPPFIKKMRLPAPDIRVTGLAIKQSPGKP